MTTLFTLRDWKQLPEGFPAELLDGCLVRDAVPTLGHQDLVGRLYLQLTSVLERRRVVLAPAGVVIDRLNVLQPDVCVASAPLPPTAADVGIPSLVFEVHSPSTRTRDRTTKTVKYLAAGVEEVWLVDPVARTLTVRTTGGARAYRDADEACSAAVSEVRFVPRDLFEDA
jgi:Uma2 family endonuclease